MLAEAATCILIRDTGADETGFEVLMLERSHAVAFAGGWVFPGGRLDEADRDAASGDDPLAAQRTAAVREIREETGITIAGRDLVPFSRWLPPETVARRFLTWFFVTAVGDVPVTVDGSEIVGHDWLTPGDALARHAAGKLSLFPPTWVTLHQLNERGTPTSVLAGAGVGPLPHFETHMTRDADGPVMLWCGDVAYDSVDRLADSGPRHRLRTGRLPWTYERVGTPGAS